MNTQKKVIVGYDLCDDYSQVCCYSYKLNEPVLIGPREYEKEEEYRIPTVLCMKNETKQWLYGEEAIHCAKMQEGYLVEHILDKAYNRDEIEIQQQKISGITLLEKFFRKSLTLVKTHFPTDPITKLVVTIKNTDPNHVNIIYEALSSLGLEKDRVVILNHAGAFLYYALSQDSALWRNDVGLFDYSREGLYYYQASINRRVKPMVVDLKKTNYSTHLNYEMRNQKKENLAYIFENTANTALYKLIVSTLYITGEGFEGDWAEAAIKNLCVGRRVFYGQNLYSKGACYAAKELSGDQVLGEMVLLNEDMIKNSVLLRVYKDAKFAEVPLAEAGEVWYDINRCLEVIPEGNAELEIILKNIVTKESVRERVLLQQLPQRPDRMTRLAIHLQCPDKSTGIITVTDLGFGELYQGTGRILEFAVGV